MSASGSPGTATRSAHLPASTVPTRSDQPRISALRRVAETIAAIGASPSRDAEHQLLRVLAVRHHGGVRGQADGQARGERLLERLDAS